MNNNAPPPSLVDPDVIKAMIDTARGTPLGCFIEVGVYKGGTAWHLSKLAKEQERPIFLYDTFKGIPYAGEFDSIRPGTFADTSEQQVREVIPYATIISGVFPDSAIEMGPIAFIHLDCDQYQSYKTAFDYLIPRCQLGTVIWFDDYSCLPGADKAVNEYFSPEKLLWDKKTYVRI